jgi:hypothetical protein
MDAGQRERQRRWRDDTIRRNAASIYGGLAGTTGTGCSKQRRKAQRERAED